MKHKALAKPKPLQAFRDKYLAACMMVVALLISLVASAQTDSVKYSQINGYGFKYKRLAFDSVLMVPLSTSPHVPYRKGGIRYNPTDSTLQLWTGYQWRSIVTGGTGIDTAYVVGDSLLVIETPNEDFFLNIRGQNISNTSLTANGDYTQNWNHHWFFLNNIKVLDLNSYRSDDNHPGNKKRFRFFSDSTIDGNVAQWMWGMKNISEDFTDSLHFELTSTKDLTYLYQHTFGGGKSIEMDWDAQAYYPGTKVYANGNGKNGYYELNASVASLEPNDSTRAKLVLTPGAAKVVTARAESSGIYTLGVADMPTGGGPDRLSAKAYYLTKEGAVSDASTTSMGTNNTAVIQSVLNNAAGGQRIVVYVDGFFSADSLKVYGNTSIIGLSSGCGLIQRPSINYPFIVNQNRTLGAIVDSSITIENLLINGNGYNTSSVAQREYYGVHGWNFVIRFTGAKNVLLNNIRIENGRTIAAYASNVRNFTVTNSIINASRQITADSLTHDGFKFDGPASDITLSNLKIYSIDDAISFCTNDGFFPIDSLVFGYHTYDPYATFGTIKNVYVENIILDSCHHGIRMLNTSEELDNIVIKNISGVVYDYLYVLDDYLGGNPNYRDGDGPFVGNVTFDGVDVKLNVTTNYANAGMYVNLPVDNLVLRNIAIRRTDTNTHPTMLVASPASIENINIDKWAYSESVAISRPVIAMTGGTVTRADIRGFSFFRASAGDEPLFQKSGGTLTNLFIGASNINNAKKIVKYTGGSATNIVLNNVIHTNGDTSVLTNSNVSQISASNFTKSSAGKIYGGTGTVSFAQGDAFQTVAPGYVAIQAGSGGTSDLILYDENNLGTGDAWLIRQNNSDANLHHTYYNPSGGTYTNWLNITPTGSIGTLGKIGIGTHTPLEPLYITGSVNNDAVRMRLNNGSVTSGYAEAQLTTDISDFRFGTGGTGSTPFGFSAGAGYVGMVSNHSLVFATNSAVRASISNTGVFTFNTGSNSFAMPTGRGTNGYALVTDGAGGTSWASVGGGSSYTFTNGLTESGGTAKLGGTLTENTTVSTTASYYVNVTGSNTSQSLKGTNTSSGVGVAGQSSSGSGVYGTSASGTGLVAESTSGEALSAYILPSSSNTLATIARLQRFSSGTAGNGIGGAFDWFTQSSNGSAQRSNRIGSVWSDATTATRTSTMEFYGVNSGSEGRKAALAGSGQWTWDTYGQGTHSVTPATTPVYSSTGVVGERIAPKIYTALLTQSGTGAPTATILGTNELGSIVWTRNSTGNYTGTLTGAFTLNKTWAICQKGDMNGSFANGLLSSSSANSVLLTVTDNAGSSVDNFTNMSIEIRVYP